MRRRIQKISYLIVRSNTGAFMKPLGSMQSGARQSGSCAVLVEDAGDKKSSSTIDAFEVTWNRTLLRKPCGSLLLLLPEWSAWLVRRRSAPPNQAPAPSMG